MSSSHCQYIGVDSEFVLTVDLLYRENSTTISALNPMLKTGRHRCVTTSHALIATRPVASVLPIAAKVDNSRPSEMMKESSHMC